MWQDLWREGKRVYSNFDQSGRNKQDMFEFLDYVSSKYGANQENTIYYFQWASVKPDTLTFCLAGIRP